MTTIRTGLLISLLLLGGNVCARSPTASDDLQLAAALRHALHDNRSFSDRFDAEVWLHDMSARLAPRIPDPQQRIDLLKMVHEEAVRAGLAPELVLAVIDVESDFDRWAISRSGAQGLMQVMPFWLQELDLPDGNLHQARTNLRLGCTILRYYLDQEGGDLRNALARYNGSLGKRRYPDKVFSILSNRWFRQ